MRFLLCVLAGVLALSGCVPNKKIVYLQHAVEPKFGEVKNSDTTSRTYTTEFSNYVLKPGDIISVRIASITPSEFDFVQKYEEQLGLIRKLTQYDQANKAGGLQQGAMMGGGGQNGSNALILDRIQSGFILSEEGLLELPYIGKLNLKGLTLSQTESLISEKLKGYFETPVVRVQLISFHFTILGEVTNEGRYTTFDPSATIIDAISIANNLTDFADRSKIKVVRTEGNVAKVFYVNTLQEDLLSQPGFYLKPNDLIIVSPLQARYSRKYGLPNYSLGLGIISSAISLTLLILTLNNK